MSTVSKRWSRLWKSMPFLYLDNEKFIRGEEDEDKSRFSRFVNNLLLLRDSSDLHSFRLEWMRDWNPHWKHHLNVWLQYAVKHTVKVIDLSFFSDKFDVVVLPSCVLACQCLEELRLKFSNTMNLKLPSFVGFGQLRELQLCNAFIESEYETMEKLVSCCPVIEMLTLEECVFYSATIAFRALRVLTLKMCDVGHFIRVFCPSLKTCHLVNDFINVMEVSLENL